MSAAPAAAAQPEVAFAPVAATSPATAQTAVAAKAKLSKQQRRANVAVKFAYKQIGDMYRWGGNGPNVWDCSGLATGAWRKAGVKLPRISSSIYRKVRHKVSYKNLRPGDLVFFYSGRSHVAIYVGHGYMIHASRSGRPVKRVKMSSYYRHAFNGAVRPG